MLVYPAFTQSAAGINKSLNFQGRLLTSSGAVVPDGNYNMKFRIYQDGDGILGGGDESLRWTEERINNRSQGVVIKNGYFSLALATYCAFDGSACTGGQSQSNAGVDFNQDTLWLSMEVTTNGTDTAVSGSLAWNGEMNPFRRLGASVYALNAGLLGGLTSSQYVQLAQGIQTTSLNSSPAIGINATAGSNNLVTLQSSGTDVFGVTSTGNLLFGGNANKTVLVEAAGTGLAGRSLTVQAGAGGGGAASTAGGTLVLQGGNANSGTGSANGGDVYVYGGSAGGSGTAGNVALAWNGSSAVGSVGIRKAANASYALDVAGNVNFIGATSGDALTVSNSTSTGNIAVFKDNDTAVLTIANGGDIMATGSLVLGGDLTVSGFLRETMGGSSGANLISVSADAWRAKTNMWVFRSGQTATITVVDQPAGSGPVPTGKVHQFTQVGAGGVYYIDQLIAIDTMKTYYGQIWAARTAGAGTFYAGYMALDKDLNVLAGNGGTYGYMLASGNTPLATGAWYYGKVSGEGTELSQFPVGTRYIKPIIITNYNVGGTMQVGGFEFSDRPLETPANGYEIATDGVARLTVDSSGDMTASGGMTIQGSGTALALSGAATTAFDISNTGTTTDISLQNGETIDNDTNGTIRLTAPTVSTTGNLTLNGGSGTLTSGAINDQTISSVASFTGTLALATLGLADSATYVCRNASNQLASCNTSGTGAAWLQGGNSVAADSSVGTNNAYALLLETNGATRLTVTSNGSFTQSGGVYQTVIAGGQYVYDNLASAYGANSVTGAFVINTNIDLADTAFWVGDMAFTLYNYSADNQADFNLSFYKYGTSPTYFYNYGYSRKGSNNPLIRLGHNPSGKVVIIVGDIGSTWSYPQISVDRVASNIGTLAKFEGWTISTGVTSLAGYTNLTTVSEKNKIIGQTASILGDASADALTVSNSTSTADIAVFKDNNTTVLTVADGGNITATGAMTIQGANALTLGLTGTATGAVVFKGATAASNAITLIGQANPTSPYTITLPSETGTVCLRSSTSCGFALNDGSTGTYIQNSTTLQSAANFFIQSAASGSVGGIIRGASSQAANLFELQTSTPATVLSVSSSGALALQNSEDSTGALVVRNAAAVAVFAVDTTNRQVGINTASPSASLYVTDIQPANVATTPATAAGSVFVVTGATGGNTTIVTTGVGGSGSSITMTGGTGGQATAATTASTGGAGGGVGLRSGIGGAATVVGTTNTGGAGGGFSINSTTNGAGGAASGGTTSNTGGVGGATNIYAGTGGAATATGTATGTGGAGAQASLRGGAGGAASGATSGALQGGDGGTVALYGGAGGTASGGTGTMAAGDGGGITIQGGASGAGATGNGGNISITAGSAASTNGSGGSITINPGARTGTGTNGSINIATSATAGDISIGTSANARTVNIATGAAAQTVTLGSTNGTSSLVLQAGSSGIDLTGATTFASTATFNGTVDFNSDTDWTLSGSENIVIASDLNSAANISIASITGTPTTANYTVNGLVIQQNNSANAYGIDNALNIYNADADLPIPSGIQLSGGAGFTVLFNSPTLDISGAGAITGATGIAMASGNFLQSGTGTFGTGTGAVSLNGDVTVASGKTLTVNSTITATGSITGAGLFSGSGMYISGATATIAGGIILQSTPQLNATWHAFVCRDGSDGTLRWGASGCGTSSARYKHDIQTMPDAWGLDTIGRLRPVTFVYNTDSTNTHRPGLIAEEVSMVLPEAVEYDANGLPQAIFYDFLVANTIKAIQQQQSQLNTLQSQISDMGGHLSTGRLTTTDLTVTGLAVVHDLVVNGHIITAGDTPTTVVGVAACGGSVSVEGNDTAGKITIVTGGSCIGVGELARVEFAQLFGAAPRVSLTPVGDEAAGLRYNVGDVSAESFGLRTATAPAINTTYRYFYHVEQ